MTITLKETSQMETEKTDRNNFFGVIPVNNLNDIADEKFPDELNGLPYLTFDVEFFDMKDVKYVGTYTKSLIPSEEELQEHITHLTGQFKDQEITGWFTKLCSMEISVEKPEDAGRCLMISYPIVKKTEE